MKPVLKVVLSLSLTAFFIIALGCGGPTGGGTSQITISISAASAKAAGTLPMDQLRHVIVFSGPTGTQTHTITGSGTVKATVVAGLWNINVTAYDGDVVYATGSASAEVKAGRNTNVTVQMTLVGAEAAANDAPYQALPNLEPDELIDNWTDLKNYIEGLQDLVTPTNLVIERTVMLYDKGLIGGIKADDNIAFSNGSPLPSGAEIKVTLIAPTNITTEISRGSISLGIFDGSMFTLNAPSGSTVTFNLSLGHPDYPQNSNLILNGAGSATIALIQVNGSTGSTTVLNMYRNVTLKNNNITGNGGGVLVSDEAIFNMFGGNITGNYGGTGGGVYVYGGTFKMSGGTISSNNANGDGGGVYIVSTAIFEMSGSAVISGNTGSLGGGIYVYNATFNMKGGEIKGNKAYGPGGGVYASSSDFNMSGGTIGPGNTAEGILVYGGGVSFEGSSSRDFTMSGNAAIIGNIAKAGGGNAFGGGVYFNNLGNFKMDPGTPAGTPKINGNIAEDTTGTSSFGRGGGVYQYTGTFTMNAGQINGNTAKGDGGNSNGGGVYVGSLAIQFAKNGGEIDGHPLGSTGVPSTGNRVLDNSGLLIPGSTGRNGHAVWVEISPYFGRASTAGAGVKLDTNNLPPGNGWELP